ncbi:hypothetical protein SUGI_1011660 [Cryptomeria japonica]|nr:hypothetical protein SUGI_1011660 [Cryptomeria japonica]
MKHSDIVMLDCIGGQYLDKGIPSSQPEFPRSSHNWHLYKLDRVLVGHHGERASLKFSTLKNEGDSYYLAHPLNLTGDGGQALNSAQQFGGGVRPFCHWIVIGSSNTDTDPVKLVELLVDEARATVTAVAFSPERVSWR